MPHVDKCCFFVIRSLRICHGSGPPSMLPPSCPVDMSHLKAAFTIRVFSDL